jgi:hypothetical protein
MPVQVLGTEPLCFLLVSLSDHISPAPGQNPSVFISYGAPNSFAGATTQVYEIGRGWYAVTAPPVVGWPVGNVIVSAVVTGVTDPADALFNVQAPATTGVVEADIQSVAGVPVTSSPLPVNLQQIAGLPVASPFPVAFSPYVGNAVAPLSVDSNGYVTLQANGLNYIDTTPEPAVAVGAPTPNTFRGMLIMLWRRFFRQGIKSMQTATMVALSDDGQQVLSSQNFTDDGAGNETLGNAGPGA